MARKLKVFRTAIGFHDAYVAAPSRKAALAAWGATADLFARGVAEEVDDPALTAEPLAQPGAVVKRSRGTAAEQIAALPPDTAEAAPRRASKPASVARPSRAALDEADARLTQSDERYGETLADLAAREARLVHERQDAERRHEADHRRLEQRRDVARSLFDAAMRDWSRRTDTADPQE